VGQKQSSFLAHSGSMDRQVFVRYFKAVDLTIDYAIGSECIMSLVAKFPVDIVVVGGSYCSRALAPVQNVGLSVIYRSPSMLSPRRSKFPRIQAQTPFAWMCCCGMVA